VSEQRSGALGMWCAGLISRQARSNRLAVLFEESGPPIGADQVVAPAGGCHPIEQDGTPAAIPIPYARGLRGSHPPFPAANASSRLLALSRSRVCQPRGGFWRIFVAKCCFKSFTLIRTFPFFPLSETRVRPSVETIRLTHAVKNAWARRQTGLAAVFAKEFGGPRKGRWGKWELIMSIRIAMALAATIGRAF